MQRKHEQTHINLLKLLQENDIINPNIASVVLKYFNTHTHRSDSMLLYTTNIKIIEINGFCDL